MKRIAFIALLIGISTFFVFAQKGKVTVSGSVFDKDDNSPVMQATVQLLALPDSSMAAGVVTDGNGQFSLSVRPGKYVLRISFIGYMTHQKGYELVSSKPTVNVGKVMLSSDAIMLSEAVVKAEAPQVTVSGDTLGYNASAYRTPEGAMLEELVKKLPGAEIDENGNVKINGKEIKKIMVGGKEFFGGDVKTGLQNLPVNMIERINAYDRQSDNARITGIDDGEEETVLDLTVKKGMNQGWFGNIDGGAGTEDRYSANANVNRFGEDDGRSYQLSIIGKANNVNDQRFGGGGGPRWRRNNGLTSNKEVGVSFASETEKLEIGGSLRYNYKDNDAVSVGQVENFLPSGNSSFANSNSSNRNKNKNLIGDFRMEWNPNEMTTFLLKGNMTWGESNGLSSSKSSTFDKDPYVEMPNLTDLTNYLGKNEGLPEELKNILVNASDNRSLSEGNSLSANAEMQLTRRLNDEGRNITFRGTGSYGDNENDRFLSNDIFYGGSIPTVDESAIRRYITTPTNKYNVGAEVSYSEPIADRTYLQFSYKFQYGYNETDNSTYNLPKTWNFGEGLPNSLSQLEKDTDQSKYAEYKNFNHDARVTFRINRNLWRLSAGVAFRPQFTKLSYEKGAYQVDTTRHVFNFSPEVDFRYQPEKQKQFRFSYRGRTSEPGMENLLPITDNSDPLNVRKGNPGLKPSFSHNLSLRFNTFNMDSQRGIFSHVNSSFTQNAISNKREYDASKGAWTTTPENINGNWNVFGMFGVNTALKWNKKFTVGAFTSARYNNNVSYITTNGATAAQKNTTTDLMLGERINGAYRNDWMEVGLNGSLEYTFEKDKLNPRNNQEPYTFSYGGNLQFYTPWNTTISTNMTNQARRGYSDSSMNRNELIWNAQVAQSFLKGALTLSLEWNDILREQSNITRTLTSSGRSVYKYNGVNSYGMVRLIYRLNIFGDKQAREGMRQGGPGMGGRGMGGPGMGGPGMGGSRGMGGGRGMGGPGMMGGGRPF